mgnify:CR=1 FL=1
MEEEKLVCAENCPHLNKINNVKSLEPKADEYQKLSNMFKLFSDETRLKIICSLLKEELCVCDLCELLGLNQSQVSHQLQLLRNSKLVKFRREGKMIYYSIDDEHVRSIINLTIEHLNHED